MQLGTLNALHFCLLAPIRTPSVRAVLSCLGPEACASAVLMPTGDTRPPTATCVCTRLSRPSGVVRILSGGRWSRGRAAGSASGDEQATHSAFGRISGECGE